jgi:hypothetical protein
MLPTNLLYSNKLESSGARAFSSSCQPQQGMSGYKNGSKITIQVPINGNSALACSESYLKGRLTGITATGAVNFMRLDRCGIHGAIQRLRIWHGTNELQDIDNYGNLVALMMSLQESSDSFEGKKSILCGTSAENILDISGNVTNISTVGKKLTTGALANTNQCPDFYFCINLMCLLGSMDSGKYLPLFELSNSPLIIELTLASSVSKFVCAQSGNYTDSFELADVEYIAQYVELSDQAIQNIRASQNGEPLKYTIQSYSSFNHPYTFANTTARVSVPITAKYASLKSLFLTFRQKADGANGHFPFSSCHYNLSQYQFRIGNQLIPSKAPSSLPEYFCELLKAIGGLSDTNHEPAISTWNYGDSVVAPNTETATASALSTKSSCFAIGIDLENFPSSDKTRIFSGMDTTSSDIFAELTFAANGLTAPILINSYALYDVVLLFENGSCRAIK